MQLEHEDRTEGRSAGALYGLEAMCVAGGMGQAMIVERLN